MSKLKKIPAKNMEVRTQVKDSKFYASIFAVQNRAEAEKRISEIRNKYADATHNVPAFRVENPKLDQEALEYYDDDGEPAGSSGPPILEAIKGKNLLNTVIIVTRYFGGTKLGIGGLIRAYGDTARLAIEKAGIEKLEEFYQIEIKTPFAKVGIVLGQLEALEAEINESKYDNQGAIVSAVIKTELKNKFEKIIKEKTGANYKLKILKSIYK